MRDESRITVIARTLRRRVPMTALAFASTLAIAAPAFAQSAVAPAQRPTLTPADYGRFESLAGVALSADGRWLAYGVSRVDEQEELRVRPLDRDTVRVFEHGTSPSFSPDSRWLVWTIGVPPEEREREEDPVRPGAGLLDLDDGAETTFERVRARSFDATGRFLALHGYAPGESRGKGADLRVVELATGIETTFGNVDSYAWSEAGSLLALLLSTGTAQGNGVQLYDAADGRLRTLDASGSSYRHMSWREDAADLVVLRSVSPMGGDSTLHTLIAWRGLDGADPEKLTLDARPDGLTAPLAIVGFTAPRWSEDGDRLSFGVRPVPVTEPDSAEAPSVEPPRVAEQADRAGARGRGGRGGEQGGGRGNDGEPELPEVQIWHTSDVLIHPQQRSRAERQARRTLLSVWTPGDNRIVQVGSDLDETAGVTADWHFGYERVTTPHAWGAMFGRPYHDLWTVDLASGERKLSLERVRYSYLSEGGRYLLSFDGKDFWSLDLRSGERANLTANLDGTFAETDSDTPTDLLPNRGVGGWMQNDEAVFLYDEYDVWRVAPDGSGGERITRGAEEGVIHRMLGIGEEPDGYRSERPTYFSLREEATERRGFARMRPGRATERLALADANLAGLIRADSADVFMYRSEARDVPENLFVAGPDLANARRVTNTNPFLSEYAWTRAELFHFESEAGIPLKGVLLYPANHDPSRRYPMIVYTYELLSQGMHNFQVPSERSYYNQTVWTQQGYFVLLPDIVYRWGDPGVSAVEAVRPAIGNVVSRGLVDPARVGLIGHSWGGYQAAYIPTRTGKLFAASVAGAPLTDFVSFMGQIHWSGGNPELSHWETGQGRMDVPYWENVESHLRNSPLHEVHNLETPMLMAFGDEDGTVEWWQGTVFYNYARRAGKRMVLLVYEGEGHGFSREPNQIDYHRRILEWFGHYLVGDPAPGWITDGVAFEDLEEEKRRVAGPRAAGTTAARHR